MTKAFDWSGRYLGLATISIATTMVVWTVDTALVLPVALATAVAFAALALLHARRVRTETF
jgi:hypothetical protein